jgi:hypothetical protein
MLFTGFQYLVLCRAKGTQDPGFSFSFLEKFEQFIIIYLSISTVGS